MRNIEHCYNVIRLNFRTDVREPSRTIPSFLHLNRVKFSSLLTSLIQNFLRNFGGRSLGGLEKKMFKKFFHLALTDKIEKNDSYTLK